jgi:peptidoglycan hydrolase-like protein with peptidoglycan-binding domain
MCPQKFVKKEQRGSPGTSTILLTQFNKSITAPGAKAGDGLLDKPLKGLANVQTNKKGEESTSLDRGGLIGTDRFGKLSQAIGEGDFKKAGTQIGLGAIEVFKNLKDIATGALNVAGDIVYKSAASDLGSKPAGSYAEGTAGAGFDFTKIVRDFGAKTPVELHGEEAVLTKKQLTDMLAGVQSSIPKMPAGIDMSKLPPIATTISSSTSGGGSTTTSRKQNEESKGAESKIADLDKERNAAMSAMTDKMRAVMGPDAKGGEVRRATRDSDEFKSMEAEYTAKREQLQKVVSDGITWETEKKSEAAEELSQAETQKLNMILKSGGDIEAALDQFESDKLTRIRYGQDEVTKITETEIAKEVTAAVEKTAKLADVAKTTEAVGTKEVEAKKVVSESSKIMAMQQELIAKGAKIKADGIMGPLTKAAMSTFNTAQSTPKDIPKPTAPNTAQVKAIDTNKVGNLSKTIPSEVAQAKAEEEKRKAAAATVVTAKPQVETATGPAIKTTQDDLYEQLIQLNTKMQELVSHSSDMATTAEKQVRATKRLDPNVALR